MGVEKEKYPGATWTNGHDYLDEYDYQEIPVYTNRVDPQKYGASIGLPRRPMNSGAWASGSNSGSRCVLCNNLSSAMGSSHAARGCNTA